MHNYCREILIEFIKSRIELIKDFRIYLELKKYILTACSFPFYLKEKELNISVSDGKFYFSTMWRKQIPDFPTSKKFFRILELRKIIFETFFFGVNLYEKKS